MTQADPSQPLALFRTPADTLFSSVEEPTSSSRRGIETSLAALKEPPAQPHEPPQDNFDDEDYEFQRALQASLMESRSRSSSTSTITSIAYSDLGEFSSSTAANEPLVPTLPPLSLSNTAPELDPVAASMERNRLLLERMRQEQEVAQRELWSDEELSPEEQAAIEERRTRRRQQEEEDEIQLQRAIEESEILARQKTGNRAPSAGAVADGGTESDDDLQTALKASLEHQSPQRNLSSSPAPSYTTNETEEGAATVEDPAQPGPSVEEIRRARLARFA